MEHFSWLKKTKPSIFLVYSALLFIVHTILLISINLNKKDFDIVNTYFFENWSGLFKFDTMGISWLYISSFIILFCQLILFSKSMYNSFAFGKDKNLIFGFNWVIVYSNKSYGWWIIYLFIIHLALTFLFLTDNAIVFYIAFETTLLPFILWIGEAALRSRRWHAGFYLTFFTLIGSIGMLWSISILYQINNTFVLSDYEFSVFKVNEFNYLFNLFYNLNNFSFSLDSETILFNNHSLKVAFFLFTFSFLIKFPVFPLASWLPEAHVEASTEASVLLAAVLLKVAPFGFYKIIIPSFSEWYFNYRSVIWIIGLVSALIYVFSLLSQTDLKRAIAYTSIIHMSIMLCLLASPSKSSMDSAFLMGALHSFCSAGLFCCIGYLYDKDKNKNLNYISGIVSLRPIFTFFFLLFNLVNVGYPLIGSYISESLLIMSSTGSLNHIYTLLIVIILYILTASIFFMMSKIFYRSFKADDVRKIIDISKDETISLSLLFAICILLGIFPSIYLNYVEDSLFNLSEMLNYIC